MTLRSFFYLLLAANLVFAVLLFGPGVGFDALQLRKGEPERIGNQLHPEQIRVLPAEPAEPRAAAPTPVSQETPEVQAAAAMPRATCVAYRGFTAQQGQLIATTARADGNGLTVRETDVPALSFWVNIPAQGGKESADRRSAQLQQMGIEDFFVVQEAGPTQYAISLGLFKSEASARRHLEALQRKGLQTARITIREASQNGRIELQGPADVLARVQQELAGSLSGVETIDCPSA